MITKVIRDRKLQPLTSVKEFQDLASKSDELAVYVQTRQGRAVRDPVQEREVIATVARCRSLAETRGGRCTSVNN